MRVFILDDHDIVRHGLRDLLTKRDITVVGGAGDSQDPRAAPACDGAGRAAPGRQRRPGVSRRTLRGSLDQGAAAHLRRGRGGVDAVAPGGAAGAVLKLACTHDIVGAVRRVRAGRSLLDQADAERAADHLRVRAEKLNPALTRSQAETLALVLSGDTDQQIATKRDQQLATVRDEVALLIARLTTLSPQANGKGSGRHRRNA